MVCPHLAKFGGHRNCSSSYLFLVYYVAKQDHVIKVSSDFNDSNPSS